tara:strand:- start:1321 stop:1992 length:672 start_codon:yes stop_codon:yes gene_type:complete
MNLDDLKKKLIREDLNISDEYGKIFSYIDFGNVNNWFEKDRQDWDNNALSDNQKLNIDITKLKEFADLFSQRTRNYYGHDPHNVGSDKFTYALRKVYGKRDFVTKKLQKIKHYISDDDKQDTLFVQQDKEGKNYVEIRKCNFDVEMSVDAIRMIDHYDTICLFSGDADFVYLNIFLRKKGKKIILIKGGHITEELRSSADIVINAQRVKKHIARVDETKETKT